MEEEDDIQQLLLALAEADDEQPPADKPPTAAADPANELQAIEAQIQALHRRQAALKLEAAKAAKVSLENCSSVFCM